MNLKDLEQCFNDAKANGHRYVGVRIRMEGFPTDEIIINEYPNFDKKLQYYMNAYTGDLTLKTFNGIKIINFTSGNSFKDIEDVLFGGKK